MDIQRHNPLSPRLEEDCNPRTRHREHLGVGSRRNRFKASAPGQERNQLLLTLLFVLQHSAPMTRPHNFADRSTSHLRRLLYHTEYAECPPFQPGKGNTPTSPPTTKNDGEVPARAGLVFRADHRKCRVARRTDQLQSGEKRGEEEQRYFSGHHLLLRDARENKSPDDADWLPHHANEILTPCGVLSGGSFLVAVYDPHHAGSLFL